MPGNRCSNNNLPGRLCERIAKCAYLESVLTQAEPDLVTRYNRIAYFCFENNYPVSFRRPEQLVTIYF